jgi:hypothetical protein
MAHPSVLPSVFHKGVNYFDLNYFRGPAWYLGHFPVASVARLKTRSSGAPVTFDASGYYMYHPLAPERMAHDMPDMKWLLMLRDPVERAYSAYQHEFARGFETESFERALELEDERLEGEVERMRADPRYESFSHRHHSYQRRGHYADQLEVCIRLFGEGHVLVVESQSFFSQPETEYRRIVDFLGLPAFEPARFDRYNARPRADMAPSTRAALSSHFAPHDEKLAALLGHPPDWQR